MTIKVKASNVASIVTLVIDVLAILASFYPSLGHVVQEASIIAGGLVTTGWVHATKTSANNKQETPPTLIHG